MQFVSYKEEHFHTIGPAGELMVGVAAWIAMQERIRISERVKAGLSRAKEHGKSVVRPKKLFDRQRVMELRNYFALTRQRCSKGKRTSGS